ncbi:MAG: hypothetical protein R3B45_01085 [Bdellovibrionota bacterium]
MQPVLYKALYFLISLASVSCGVSQSGGGIVDNGNKPTEGDNNDTEMEHRNSPKKPTSPIIKNPGEIIVLKDYLINVTADSWQIKASNQETVISFDDIRLVFSFIDAPCDKSVTTNKFDVNISECSINIFNIDPKDGNYLQVKFNVVNPEALQVLQTFRVRLFEPAK